MDYNAQMGGVDVSDMMTNTYAALRKTRKWYKKLAFHLSDLCMTNAYVLYKHVTGKPIPHCDFVMAVAKELIDDAVEGADDRPTPQRAGRRSTDDCPTRLAFNMSEHWPEYIQPSANAKKKLPTKVCVVCAPPARRGQVGDKRPRPESRYWCPECNVGLHPQCFKAYHTKKLYKQ